MVVILNLFQDLASIPMISKEYYIYILTNTQNNVLYIGVTGNIIKRIDEHKNKLVKGFSERYNLKKLVYFETTKDVKSAITREKQLKNWHRDWKVNLIKSVNPQFDDIYQEILK